MESVSVELASHWSSPVLQISPAVENHTVSGQLTANHVLNQNFDSSLSCLL